LYMKLTYKAAKYALILAHMYTHANKNQPWKGECSDKNKISVFNTSGQFWGFLRQNNWIARAWL